jgi:hypothetical protein
MSDQPKQPYVPYSQRSGSVPVPPQLKLGEVSSEFRRLAYYAVHLEVDRESYAPYQSAIFKDGWKRVATDLHVRIFKRDADTFDHSAYNTDKAIKKVIDDADVVHLFDFIEFFLRHPNCSAELKRELRSAFVDSRLAYRVFDNQVAAIGTEEQADAFLRAIDDAQAKSATGARKHLLDAGSALRNADWAGCVRNSISAVESVAVKLSPGENTLGAALKAIEKKGHLHGSLKAAFNQLYGYSSDEEGVRHALVFSDEAQVDEADALFMLGACAAFVSYLLARGV